MQLPNRLRPICLAVACPDATGEAQFHVRKLRKTQRLAKAQLSLPLHRLDEEQRLKGASFVDRHQVLHYGQPQIARSIHHLTRGAQVYDMGTIIRDLPAISRALSFQEIAERQGFPGNLRAMSASDPEAAFVILQHIWATLVIPHLGFLASGQQARTLPARPADIVRVTGRGLPLPAPLIPELPEPVRGWRCTPWGAEEAQECGYRFAEGASLEELASHCRRSPRAIHARLLLDGIITDI